MTDLPPEYYGSENAPASRAGYGYVLHHENGTAQFFTSWDVDVTVSNLPAAMAGAAPQVFTSSQIAHEPVRINDQFSPRKTMLSVPSTDQRLRRFLTTAAAVRLDAWIIRFSTQALAEGTLDFTRSCVVIEKGILTEMGFRGNVIVVQLVPEVFAADRSVPRFFYNRTCNHALYGAGCNLDKDDFAWETEIVSLNPAQKELVVLGQEGASDRWTNGHFRHPATGLNLTVAWSAHDGTDTKLKLWNWTPEMLVGQDLTLFPGCLHTVATCRDKFSNVANFGGFPHVPNSNPALNGPGGG